MNFKKTGVTDNTKQEKFRCRFFFALWISSPEKQKNVKIGLDSFFMLC